MSSFLDRATPAEPPPERSDPDTGAELLQLRLKFAVAAASSRFNPRPPVIGQLLRGKKSTPWQPDKPIKSPAGVTAATLQAGVGWAEEPSGHSSQLKSLVSIALFLRSNPQHESIFSE
ncbi:Reelin [Manis pentadactyla]|nr:Reelin [Manis pentadactyla]